MTSVAACKSRYYQGGSVGLIEHHPFAQIWYDTSGYKEMRIVSYDFGRTRRTTYYYSNGQPMSEGHAAHRKASQCLYRISKKGPHKYWTPDGKPVWTEIYEHGDTIDPIPQETLWHLFHVRDSMALSVARMQR